MVKRILVFIIVLTVSLQAQSASDVISKLQNKLSTSKNTEISFNQKTISKGEQLFKLSGKLQFTNDDKYRLDLRNTVIVSDGKNLWNYNSKKNRVVINHVDEEAIPILPSYYLFELPKESDLRVLTEDGKNKIAIAPRNNISTLFKQVKLSYDKDFVITQIEIKDNNGNDIVIILSNYKFNSNFGSELFKFIPPQGTKIVDLR